MNNAAKVLIDLCKDTIEAKNKKIEDLENENKRLLNLISKKNNDYNVLYDRLLDKGEEVKNLNQDMLDMALKCSQRVTYAW